MKATPICAAVLLTACTMAASTFVAAPARAADLYGESYVEPPYDDEPGYADNGYGAPDEGDDRYDTAEPMPGSIKDGYPVSMPAPGYGKVPAPRYGEERGRERVYERVERRVQRVERRPACLARWEIRRRLADQGWGDIRPMGGGDGIVRMSARRFDSSSRFRLRVDRCSGEVLAARPDHTRHFAYGDGRWR